MSVLGSIKMNHQVLVFGVYLDVLLGACTWVYLDVSSGACTWVYLDVSSGACILGLFRCIIR